MRTEAGKPRYHPVHDRFAEHYKAKDEPIRSENQAVGHQGRGDDWIENHQHASADVGTYAYSVASPPTSLGGGGFFGTVEWVHGNS
jgi:hypothetical protein